MPLFHQVCLPNSADNLVAQLAVARCCQALRLLWLRRLQPALLRPPPPLPLLRLPQPYRLFGVVAEPGCDLSQ
jgi:hypothetical protein